MTNNKTPQSPISQSTSISIALVGTMLACAFWIGSQFTSQRIRMETLTETQRELKHQMADHEKRLGRLEQ